MHPNLYDFHGLISIIKRYGSRRKVMFADINESTAGADASVEMPKLHNIKLLIAVQ